jgi:hypothetical protein
MPGVRVWTLYATALMLRSAGGLATEFLPALFRQAQLAIDGAEDLKSDAKVMYIMPTYVSLAGFLGGTAEVIASSEDQQRSNEAIIALSADLVGQVTKCSTTVSH